MVEIYLGSAWLMRVFIVHNCVWSSITDLGPSWLEHEISLDSDENSLAHVDAKMGWYSWLRNWVCSSRELSLSSIKGCFRGYLHGWGWAGFFFADPPQDKHHTTSSTPPTGHLFGEVPSMLWTKRIINITPGQLNSFFVQKMVSPVTNGFDRAGDILIH